MEAEAKAKRRPSSPRVRRLTKATAQTSAGGRPEPKAQRNFTIPKAASLKTKDGYIQGYNAQAASTLTRRFIVAHPLGKQMAAIQNQFAPRCSMHQDQSGQQSARSIGRCGYCSPPNLAR